VKLSVKLFFAITTVKENPFAPMLAESPLLVPILLGICLSQVGLAVTGLLLPTIERGFPFLGQTKKTLLQNVSSGPMTRPILLWPNLIVIGTIITLGMVVVGNSASGYGFPLPWRTGGCPPPGIALSAPCLLAIGSDWLSFGLDALFYTFVGYGLVLANSKYRTRRQAR